METLIKTENVSFGDYNYLKRDDRFFRGCTRCGGTGHYSFNGYDSICYKCNNDSSAKLGEFVGDEAAAQKDSVKRAKARAARAAKRDRAQAAALARLKQAQELFKAEHPEVHDFLMAIDINEDLNTFIISLAQRLQWHVDEKPFTDKMVEAVKNFMRVQAERDAVDAARPAIEAGRYTITGIIKSAKIVQSDFGAAYKILVEDDRGFKVWGSLPKAQADEQYDAFNALTEAAGYERYSFGPGCWFLGTENDSQFADAGVKGKRIRFDATITPSNDDKSFGFASRPTKGAWL